MTQKEFIDELKQRGYAKKKHAQAYCKQHPKQDYSESDLIDAYRYADRMDTFEDLELNHPTIVTKLM